MPRAQRRPYLADAFQLLLTVTNLRGVPYGIPLHSGVAGGAHAMSLHADFAHFCINDSGGGSYRDATYLAWDRLDRPPGTGHRAAQAGGLGVQRLSAGAVAPGAGASLPSARTGRLLQHPGVAGAADWSAGPGQRLPLHQCPIPAEWGELEPGYAYRFLCVDGGVMNNEPLELARRLLAGADGRNPREGDRADRAVLMIDPFPGESLFTPDYQPPADMFGILTALFGS